MKKRKLFFLLPVLGLLTSCDVSKDLNSESFTNKLIPNWPSFLMHLGALLVLIFVVIFFAYKPVKKIMAKRQDYVEQNIKEAEEAKATWQENETKSKAAILESNKEAANIVAQAKKDAENDIARMEIEAQEAIRKEIVEIALDASKELLGREVNSSDNSRLIEEFIEEVKKED